MIRYLYANSTRTSHAVERIKLLDTTRTVCLCGPMVDKQIGWGWEISFDRKKPLCKTCAKVIAWREEVMQRRYRTSKPLKSFNPDRPWQLPRGAVSVAVTFEQRRFYVHFLAVGKVTFAIEDMDKHADWFEWLNPPVAPGITDLPLFQEELSA